MPVQLGALPAHLCLPRVRESDSGVVTGIAPAGFYPASSVVNGWVSHTKMKGDAMQCQLHALAFEILMRSTLPVAPEEMARHSVQNDPAFTKPIHDWIGRFGRWSRLLLGQMLDPSHPSPAALNTPHHSQFMWGLSTVT